MRLLHTADWHLGRTLEGRSRAEEQEAVLNEICTVAEEEAVDAVLMAGDVFDTVNPPAASEALFYETAERLSASGRRPLLIIAGNHDSPDRLQAASPLADRQGITIIGRPLPLPRRFVLPRTGESLTVAFVPYPSEARLNDCLSASGAEELLQRAYQERLTGLFYAQSRYFSKQAVSVLLTHLFVGGSQETESERPIQVGGAYTVDRGCFPPQTQYVALGHLHRAQTLSRASVPTRYAGAPLAYSFSEAGQEKSVTIIDVAPGGVPAIRAVPLHAGRRLVRWRAEHGSAEVLRWIEAGRDEGAWIDLEIRLKEAMTMHDIQKLRSANPLLVNIRPIYEAEQRNSMCAQHPLPIDELFVEFYRRQTGGADPGSGLVRLFMQLLEEAPAEEEAGGACDETD
ncbi:MAG: exonuclease subunit SbcD [Sporolactobacillus sp.]